jgi:aspartyl-tRNA(Asn)/glutamyl-tRNA(Gln) amidotransferase subunit A
LLQTAGASVVEVQIPHAQHADAIGYTIMFAEFASLHEITFNRLSEYGGMTRQNLANSQFVHASDYLRALRARHLLQRDFEAVFQVADALITPGMAAPAPTLDMVFTIEGIEKDWSDVAGNMTLVMNVTGVPALSIPSGLTSDGLPMGIQIAARPFGESMCLRIGAAFQRLTSHHLASPY